MTRQYWCRQWICDVKQQDITWSNVDIVLCHHMVSRGATDIKHGLIELYLTRQIYHVTKRNTYDKAIFLYSEITLSLRYALPDVGRNSIYMLEVDTASGYLGILGQWMGIPNNKVHGGNMGPIWGRQGPGGAHVGPMNLAIWDITPAII